MVERPANKHTLTGRYTQKAIDFIRGNKDKPFFLYLAHNLPHIPCMQAKITAGTAGEGSTVMSSRRLMRGWGEFSQP